MTVRNRLRRCLNEWYEIGAPELVLDVIKEGYKIPLEDIPETAV